MSSRSESDESMSDQSSQHELAERLKETGYFSEATITTVLGVAAQQREAPTYQDFFTAVQLPTPALFHKDDATVAYIDCPAKSNKAKGVLVVHLPMANPLDTNQLFQVATIVAANPQYRVIAFGNPSGGAFSFAGQNLSAKDRRGIAQGTHKEALVKGELAYLASQHISHVSHAGYSYGALKALIETYYAHAMTVEKLIVIEPPAHPRSLIQLANDFLRTDAPLNQYVNRTNTPIFIAARKDAINGNAYKMGLLRPINRAIARLLARTDFIDLLTKAMVRHPAMKVTLAWAEKSELGNDAHFTVSAHHLSLAMPGRFQAFRFIGAHHALANDVHLHAAIIRQALDE